MTKEFIPYQEALELKELGFNEPCLGWYSDKNIRISGTDGCVISFIPKNSLLGEDMISAPLYQQAFRWFREKYVLNSQIPRSIIKKGSYYFIINEKSYGNDNKYWDSYEEAELACLRKFIELVKQQP